jgi:hypothetical protein
MRSRLSSEQIHVAAFREVRLKAETTETPGEIVVPLRSKRARRSLALQKLNHVIPAAGLFFAGMQAIREGHSGLGFYLGVFELVSSAALIVLFARELRAALHPKHPMHPAHSSHHEHPTHGVDWVDIAAGFVLVAEALEHWHVTHHWPRPTLLTAFTTFALGLFHGRIASKKAKRRVLRVTADGVRVSGRLFKARRLEAGWKDLRSIDIGPRYAVVATQAGRTRKLDLMDLEHPELIRAALSQAQVRLSEDRAAASR